MQNNVSELKEELQESLTALGIVPEEIENKDYIINQILSTYVNGNPRAWWLSLKGKKEIIDYTDDSAYLHLVDTIKKIEEKQFDPNKSIYFIIDDDNEQMYIYIMNPLCVKSVIESCQYFEYYVVALDLSWLIAENDHGQLIVCRA